jgi:hypothetical protein
VLSDEVSDYGPTRAHYPAHVSGPAGRSTVDSLGAPSLVHTEEVNPAWRQASGNACEEQTGASKHRAGSRFGRVGGLFTPRVQVDVKVAVATGLAPGEGVNSPAAL